jgi:transposase
MLRSEIKMTKGFESILNILITNFGKRRTKVIICLILMIFGISNSEIKSKMGISYDALRKYRNALESENIEPLFINNGYREKSELEKYDEIIFADFDKNPPKTLREAKERIKELTGLTRSLHRIRVYLLKRGLKVVR